MLVVAVNSELVATMLAGGVGPPLPNGARCPTCDGRLRAWPGYARFVRHHGHTTRLWVRRGACRACGATHALLAQHATRVDPLGRAQCASESS